MAINPVLGLQDLRFLLARSKANWLVEERGGTLPLGPTGIRKVPGVGNVSASPSSPAWWFGSADTLFRRISFNRITNPLTKGDVISSPFANTIRGAGALSRITISNTSRILDGGIAIPNSSPLGTVVDSLNPRTISNLIADVSNPIGFQALDPQDPNYLKQQELLEQDNPAGRIGPADGGINPLPYSNWLSQFGQFFDHGLDFVNKGTDGSVDISILPSDSLFGRALEANAYPILTASRNNTANVTIGTGSSNDLINKLGLTIYATDAADYTTWAPLSSLISDTPQAASFFAFSGTLVLNKQIIAINANNALDLIAQINRWTPTTGVTASVTPQVGDATYLLTLTPARAESFNQISPPVDLSQNYGSDNSRTFFVREYLSVSAWQTASNSSGLPTLTDLTTGRLVNAGVTVNGQAFSGQASWATVKANALNVGIRLHDIDVNDVPLVAFNQNGQIILGSDGLPYLVALHKTTGQVAYVRDSYLGSPINGLTSPTDYVLATTGHAFLNDKAAFSLASKSGPPGFPVLTVEGDNPPNYASDMQAYFTLNNLGSFQSLDAHKIAGDGRLNENIGLTAVHEIFTNEHNRILTLLKQQYNMPAVLPAGGFNWTDPLTNQTTKITNEDLFQQAKIWCEMIYQHLTFDSFIRKLSPNVAGFAGVVPNLDSQIFAEFAHAVYRLGHSMLPEFIDLKKSVSANQLRTTAGSSVVTIQLDGHGLKNGDPFTLSGVNSAIGGIAAENLNGSYFVSNVTATTFQIDLGPSFLASINASGLPSDQVVLDLSRSLISAFLTPQSFIPGSTAGLLGDGSASQVGYRIDEKVSDSLRDNLLGRPLDLATLNLVRGRDAGLPTLNELRASIASVAPLLLQPTLQPYTSWFSFRDNLKGDLAQQNATVKNFMMAYAADSILSTFADVARAAITDPAILASPVYGGLDTLEEWYALRASTTRPEADQFMSALKAATDAAFSDSLWMGTGVGSNTDFNRIDAWIGGLAEREVVGGMLGSTFDAVFAIQMMNLQNADFFYYLGRVPLTEFFVEGMEGNQYSDLVIRNTTATDIYGDIFSVADSYVKLDDIAGIVTTATFDELSAVTSSSSVFDLQGNVITADVGTSGFVANIYTGNPGNYVDARNVLNPNGIGNASEMITGTSGADLIDSLGGNDTVRAGAGNDIVNGGSGVDYLYGEDGADTLNGDAENDFMYGGAGNDTMRGGIGLDVMFGHADNDLMYGGLDADVMVGGTGDDTMYGGDGLTVAVVDPLHLDVLTALDPEPSVAIAVLDDTIDGGQGNDILYGGGGWDVLNGNSGHDILLPGTGGANILGRESLNGGHGDDLYIVEYASWFLDGNYADTGLTTSQLVNKSLTFRDGPNSTVVTAGVGNGIGIDEVRFTQTSAANIVLGGTNLQGIPQIFSGIERVTIGTGLGNVAVRTGTALINIDASLLLSPGGAGSTQGLELLGNAANNSFVGTAFNDLLDGGAGLDILEGGLGNDIYVIDNAGDVIIEALAGGGNDTVRVVFNASYTLAAQLENLELIGTNGTANINGTGNGLANRIVGNNGNNLLLGLGGNDTMDGGAGADILDGGAGFDRLTGGSGTDQFRFSSSADIGFSTNPALIETISDFAVGFDLLNFSAISPNFTFLSSLPTGPITANQLFFESTSQILYGYVNTDAIADFKLYLPGVQSLGITDLFFAPLVLNGNNNANILNGGNGNDTINGNGGNDTINGFGGNDLITGGAGADTMTGGPGNDTFRYLQTADSGTAGATRDLITDFSQGDIIDVSAIDANQSQGGNQAFTYIGIAAFGQGNGNLGQIRFDTALNELQFNTTGNTNPEMAIAINFAAPFTFSAITAANFIL